MIETMDKHNRELSDLSIQEHTDKIPHQSGDDLEIILLEKLDIRKAFKDPDEDNKDLEEFLQRDENPLYAMKPKTLRISRSKIDPEAVRKKLKNNQEHYRSERVHIIS